MSIQLVTVILIFFFVLSMIYVGGPTLLSNFPTQSSRSGIFKSFDSGITWFLRSNTASSIGALERKNILDVGFNLQDPKNVYLGTKNSGLYVTFDYGETWTQMIDSAGQLSPSSTVLKIIVDPKDSNNIYVSVLQNNYGSVLRSKDAGRSFETVYTTAGQNQKVISLAINSEDPKFIYIGTSVGGVFESEDFGSTWKLLKFFDSPIRVVFIPKNDSKSLYIGAERGLFKTTNRGANFTDLSFSLSKIDKNNSSNNLFIASISADYVNPRIIYIGTKFGALKSTNGGLTFTPLNVLIPKNFLPVEVIETDPFDSKVIYLGAGPLVYKTVDGGIHWSVDKLPTINRVKVIKVSPTSSKEIYLGVSDKSIQ